jgi:hypothetical protein
VFPGVHNRHPSRVRDPGLYHIRDLDRPNLDVVRRVAELVDDNHHRRNTEPEHAGRYQLHGT